MYDARDGGDAAAERVADQVRPLEAEGAAHPVHHRRIEGVAWIEVPGAADGRALAEAREIERDRAPTRGRDALDRLGPVLGPPADAVYE